jgi:hypothetical protein
METKNLVSNANGVETNVPIIKKIAFEPCSMKHVGIEEV